MDINESFAREWFLEQLQLFPQLPVLHLTQADYAAMKNGNFDADIWLHSVYNQMAEYQSALQVIRGGTRWNSPRLHEILFGVLKDAGKLEIV